jgi:hypothetical protein
MSTCFCETRRVAGIVAPQPVVRQAAVPETAVELDYRIARTFTDRCAAFRLVYGAYLRSGLGVPNRYEMRVTPYHLLPTTEIFVAKSPQEMMFTMSLVMDGELGLPMESVYGPEVVERRQRGLRFAEVSCLADRHGERSEFLPIMVKLGRLLVQYSHRQGLDELLIAVHPKHARFYRRFMGFEVIGEERSYPTVRNRPAVALCMNFANLAVRRPECHAMFFADKVPDEQLWPQPIPASQREYFRAMIDPAFTMAPLGDREEEASPVQPPLQPVAIPLERATEMTAATSPRLMLKEGSNPTQANRIARFTSAGCV